MQQNVVNSQRPLIPQIQKRIGVKPPRPESAERIQHEFGLPGPIARILAARGFDADQRLKIFLKPSLQEGLPSPSDLRNIDRACELIAEVVRDKGSIAICCDFDVDGLSGGAQVYHFLRALGVRAQVFVPDRFADGYGLNVRMIEDIVAQGFALVLTIDYGTTNKKELNFARENGLKTIVVDHHHVHEAPPADVFINPNQEQCGFAGRILCASGLAWYMVAALRHVLPGGDKIDPRRYLDLACLGTICDMVPLRDANRVIARKGLESLVGTTRPGLIALKEVAGIKGAVNCSHVSYGIGPRINAAGRLENASSIITLLTTEKMDEARAIAREVNRLNLERQELENEVRMRALQQLAQQSQQIPDGIVIWHPEFHTGVVGIVAQRMVEHYYRPAALMGVDTEGIFKGSVRGIKGFNVVEALTAVGEHLLKFGGHEGAGGFSVEAKKVETFAAAFVAECRKRLVGLETVPKAEADTEVTLDEVTVSLVERLKELAPFGVGNPAPQVMLRGLKVAEVRSLKNTHLKATLTSGEKSITGMIWRQPSHPVINRGAKIDVVARPDTNTFNGLTELQLIIQGAELSR